MRSLRAKLHLPDGPLRRFRLPPSSTRRPATQPRTRRRAWALLPFALFVLLTCWLSLGRPLPDVRHWLAGPPRADAPAAARGETLQLEAKPPVAARRAAAEASAPPRHQPSEATTPPPDKRPKRKPALSLGRHRLRPVLGWEQPSHGGRTNAL